MGEFHMIPLKINNYNHMKIKNFYNYFVALVAEKFEGINTTTRIKRFVFRFITVAGRWVYQGREWILKLFTERPYLLLI